MSPAHRVLQPDDRDPTAAGLCALTVMTKAPRAGYVKTRLSPPLTSEQAAALNTCFLRDTAAAISGVSVAARGIGCYTPAGSEAIYRDILPCDFQLIAQRGDSFGERLRFAIEDLLAIGFDSVCLIDSDSPTVPAAVYREAVNALAAHGDVVVIGPSDDGGYYLIGVNQSHPGLFAGIDWSTDRVFDQTLERATATGLPAYLLPRYYDVDDRAALARLCDELCGRDAAPEGCAAPATRELLSQISASLER